MVLQGMRPEVCQKIKLSVQKLVYGVQLSMKSTDTNIYTTFWNFGQLNVSGGMYGAINLKLRLIFCLMSPQITMCDNMNETIKKPN